MTASDASHRRKQRIAERFGSHAADYDRVADLQRRVATRLARRLLPLRAPDVLEIGCGTGFFSRQLVAAYPDGDFTLTDIAPPMLAACERALGSPRGVRFALMDGERPPSGRRYDLIASSMTLQWFDDPLASLARLRALLKPGGHLVYASIGDDLFPEWRATLTGLGLPCGVLDMPALPGRVAEQRDEVRFASGVDFLASLRLMGASEPRARYRPLSAGELRRALRSWETRSGGVASWHVVYGVLGSEMSCK